MWRYKGFLAAVGTTIDTGFRNSTRGRFDGEQAMQNLANRETWLHVAELVDKNGYTFHKVTGVLLSDVCVGEDGSMVLRGSGGRP
jgi:hypothetical protein